MSEPSPFDFAFFLDDLSKPQVAELSDSKSISGFTVIGEASAKLRKEFTNQGNIVGMSCSLLDRPGDGTSGYNLWPKIKGLFTSSSPVADKKSLAEDILDSVLRYVPEFPDKNESVAKPGYTIWAQDFEFNPGKVDLHNEVYAAITAILWAGRQLLGKDFLITPVPSSSLFKNLGDFNTDVILNGDGSTPYLTSLGLNELKDDNPQKNPDPSGPIWHGEWNFLSMLYENELIDGFLGQQYSINNADAIPGSISADTRHFYPSQNLPYSIISSWDGEVPQLQNNDQPPPPWKSHYDGLLPYQSGIYIHEEVPQNFNPSEYLIPENDGLISLSISEDQSQAPVLDFSDLSDTDSIDVSYRINRNVNQDATLGFYRVLNADGWVRDPITGDILKPGDSDYTSAALNDKNVVEELSRLNAIDRQITSNSTIIQETSMLAPFVQTIPNRHLPSIRLFHTYFAFEDANPDEINHFSVLGPNTFGTEVNPGGGNLKYDDMIIELSFNNVESI